MNRTSGCLPLRKAKAFPPNFLVKKFSLGGQFPQMFGRSARKSAETVLLRKMSHNEIR